MTKLVVVNEILSDKDAQAFLRLEKSLKVQNSLVTTVELLAKDIVNRAESDRMLREQEKEAALMGQGI